MEELIKELRDKFGLTDKMVSDKELLAVTKGTLLRDRIEVNLKLQNLLEELKNSFLGVTMLNVAKTMNKIKEKMKHLTIKG